MGLLTSIGEKFSNTIKAGINSAANSMAELSNSFIYTGGAILNTGVSVNSMSQSNSLSDETFFDYLQSYHFIVSTLDIFTSCIKDAIIRSDFHCTIIGDKLHTDRANELIDQIQLKQFVLDNLRDMVYRGIYVCGIDYQKRKLFSFNDPYNCKVITNTKDVLAYEIDGKLISNDNVIAYYYNLTYETAIEYDANKVSELDLPEEIKDLIIKFKKYKPTGIYNGKLFRVFQMYSLECALYYLGLRESMRPTLLAMGTGGRGVNVANAIEMANRVETILNEPITGLSQFANPSVYMNQLVWSMLNNIKVVPSIEQYSNISDINAGDVSAKRDKLAQELENIKKEVLNELTIPEELYGGSANRWEQYSRSDRFTTTIDSYLSSISTFVKQIISKYTGISQVSINFTIDTSSITASFDTKNKISTASEKFTDIGRLISSFNDILENEYIVKTKAYDYLKDQVKAIDSKLGDILISKLQQIGEESDGDTNYDGSSEDDGEF